VLTEGGIQREAIAAVLELGNFVDGLIAGLQEELKQALPGMGSDRIEFRAATICVDLAVKLVFLHELGHVLRGHLDHGRTLLEAQDSRRALETDADLIAGILLSIILPILAQLPPPPHTEAKPLLSWWLSSLLASWSVFSVLAEGGSLAGGFYHAPFTRLCWIADQLKVQGSSAASRKLLASLAAPANGLVPTDGSGDAIALRKDMHEFDTLTAPLRRQYDTQGMLRGWLRL
jgi:hypothetical protein